MEQNNRILIVDDNESIHADFHKIFTRSEEQGDLASLEMDLFGKSEVSPKVDIQYEVDSALQGVDAVEMVQKAQEEGRPYFLIFMDVRMPPGIDGVEAISRIWKICPNVEVVLCSAYTDYSWDQIIFKLGITDHLLFLKKPFEIIEVEHLALSLLKKWNLQDTMNNHVVDLEDAVLKRTKQLDIYIDNLLENSKKLEKEIKEKEEAEQALFIEKELMAVTLHSMSDGLITIDNSKKVIMLNQRGEEILGVDHLDVVSQEIFSFIDVGDKDLLFQETVGFVLETGESKGLQEYLMKDKEGVETPVSMICNAIFDEDDSIKGVVLVIQDISEKKKLEQEMLHSVKLESVGQLAGGIAHDFKNILTAVTGNVSLGKLFIDDAKKVEKHLDAAESAAFRASELANQLLTFSKGGMPIKSLSLLHDILVESSEFALTGSNIKCNYQINPELWSAEVDKGQISQVVNNLIINAKQAMPNGGCILLSADNILVTERDQFQNLALGKYISLSVEDEGVGVSPEHLRCIFDPYFTTKATGTGLGLATSYSIIKKHGGDLLVESEIGKGTKFTIYLPAIAIKLNEDRKNSGVIRKGQGKILVMDDEETIREMLDHILSELGYKVVLTGNGEEAVNTYRVAFDQKTPFDVVIMDLTVPGGYGGKEAIQKLIEICPEVKGIVSSGYSDNSVMANYKEYGFSARLQKPYKIKDISLVLDTILQN